MYLCFGNVMFLVLAASVFTFVIWMILTRLTNVVLVLCGAKGTNIVHIRNWWRQLRTISFAFTGRASAKPSLPQCDTLLHCVFCYTCEMEKLTNDRQTRCRNARSEILVSLGKPGNLRCVATWSKFQKYQNYARSFSIPLLRKRRGETTRNVAMSRPQCLLLVFNAGRHPLPPFHFSITNRTDHWYPVLSSSWVELNCWRGTYLV